MTYPGLELTYQGQVFYGAILKSKTKLEQYKKKAKTKNTNKLRRSVFVIAVTLIVLSLPVVADVDTRPLAYTDGVSAHWLKIPYLRGQPLR